MINLLTHDADLNLLSAQPVAGSNNSLTTELKNVVSQTAPEHLSQHGDEEVEQIMQQQLVPLIVVSS